MAAPTSAPRPAAGPRGIAVRGYAVKRSAVTRIPVRVPAHEAAILRYVFGAESVTATDVKPVTVPMPDVIDEYQRLLVKHGAEAVRSVYPSPRDLADAMGAPAPAAGAHVDVTEADFADGSLQAGEEA